MIATLSTRPSSQIDLPHVANIVVVVTAAQHEVLRTDLYGGFAANASFSTHADFGDWVAVVVAPGGVDVASLVLALVAPLQAAVYHLLDDSTPMALLTPIYLFLEGSLNYLSHGSLAARFHASLFPHELGIILFQSF